MLLAAHCRRGENHLLQHDGRHPRLWRSRARCPGPCLPPQLQVCPHSCCTTDGQTDRQTDTHTHTHTHTIFCRTTQTRWHFLHCMHACTHFARISSHACMHARMYACRTTHTHNVVHDLITYTHADTCTRSCIHLCVCIRRYWHYCHLLVVCLIMSIWVLSLKALHRTPEGGTCALSAMMFYSSSHVHVV